MRKKCFVRRNDAMQLKSKSCESIVIGGVPIFVDFVDKKIHEIQTFVQSMKTRIKEPTNQGIFTKLRKFATTNESTDYPFGIFKLFSQ